MFDLSAVCGFRVCKESFAILERVGREVGCHNCLLSSSFLHGWALWFEAVDYSQRRQVLERATLNVQTPVATIRAT